MKTIPQAERQLFLALHDIAQTHPMANEWLARLPQWLADIKDKRNYAHAPAYLSAVERLPEIADEHKRQVDLNDDSSSSQSNKPSNPHSGAISINLDWKMGEYKQTQSLLKNLMPWRKGPFFIGNADKPLHIDTEWHSDWKWNRVSPHLSSLQGRRILDVGGGSGYHGWRMRGAGADCVIVIDPSCLFYHQFMAIRHFVGDSDGFNTHYIPVPLEALPEQSQLFDTVFSMGVLYHRASPFEHLNLLKGQLAKGGELVLETLVVEGDENTVLVPKDRYAMMNNVYFLPSVPALRLWLEKAGFSDVKCVDIDVTSTEEQRATEWMDYQSLADFLDPDDPTKTAEGHPAPMRAVMVAKKA